MRIAISVSNIVGVFVALHWGFGITGIALAYVIVSYIYLPVYLYLLNILVNIKFSKYLTMLIAPIVAATIMSFSIFALKPLLYRVSIPDFFYITIPDFIISLASVPSYITIPVSTPIIYLCALIIIGVISYIISFILISPTTFKNLLNMINEYRGRGIKIL
jgi:hypothetical protein